MADNIQWTEADGFPLAGTYVGPQAVLEGVFMRLGEIGDDFAVVPEQFIADGDTSGFLAKAASNFLSSRMIARASFTGSASGSGGSMSTRCKSRRVRCRCLKNRWPRPAPSDAPSMSPGSRVAPAGMAPVAFHMRV